MVDATRATVDNEAELVAASARFSCPLATSYLAVSVQDLMAADRHLDSADRWLSYRSRYTRLPGDPHPPQGLRDAWNMPVGF